jgi:hypothetical protein
MLVPEAPVNEDHLPPTWKNDVWRAGQVSPVNAKPITKPMRKPANQHLGLAPGLADARHASPHDVRYIFKSHNDW